MKTNQTLEKQETVSESVKATGQANYTPGPWKITRARLIQVVDGVDTFEIEPASGQNWVAQVIVEADARLIAAAPELLKELRYALRCAETHSLGDLANHCRSAIAKAEGTNHV